MRTPAMRAWDWMRFAGLALVVLAGCGDSGTVGPGSPPDTRPLVFEYFTHPRWVPSGAGFAVRAGVLVGPGSRWVIESVGVVQRGDSIVLQGTAAAGRPAATPPDRTLEYDTLTIAVPPLADGIYRLVAGDLTDGFEVSVIGPPGADTLFVEIRPFAAHGQFVLQAQSACIWFEPRHPLFDEVAGWVTEGTVETGHLRGTLVGGSYPAVVCDGVSAGAIHIREFTPGVMMGDTQPVLFESFVHPGVLETNRPGEIQAHVFVGPSSCWELLEAGITVRHDTLALSGTAMQMSNEPCARILVYETATMPIPPLPAGEFTIVAENWLLVDTLVVSSYASPSKPHVAAVGTLCPPQGDWRCGEPEFVPVHPGSNPLSADVAGPLPVDRCRFGSMTGILVETIECAEAARPVLHLRGWRSLDR